ncbi:MAG TPA: chemotaxis protein CheW [Planctomycetota bacterium]|nr:chemotaxis protein CheW [Planctomycetota bacterium]
METSAVRDEGAAAAADRPAPSLVVRVGDILCALPLASVVETCRPLPRVPGLHADAFSVGVARLRGVEVVVWDLAALLGTNSAPRRWLALKGPPPAALAVEEVLGVAASSPVADAAPSSDRFGDAARRALAGRAPGLRALFDATPSWKTAPEGAH